MRSHRNPEEVEGLAQGQALKEKARRVRDAAVLELHAKGLCPAEIGARLGKGRDSFVYNLLRGLGLKPNRRRETA